MYLYCGNNNITHLNTSKNIVLKELSCEGNKLQSIDISKNIKLVELDCDRTEINNLDISNNTLLSDLSCVENSIPSLDLSKHKDLTYLNCSKNRLSALNVTQNTFLKELICYQNQLNNLDVSHNTELIKLNCFLTGLSQLDVSNNTNLKVLDCQNNTLGSLDLSNNTLLRDLDCSKNPIKQLDLSNNPALERLSCTENELTELDLTNHSALEYLVCYDNLITTLDLSNNVALDFINCSYNLIKTLDLSNATVLNKLHCNDNELNKLSIGKINNIESLSCYNNRLPFSELFKLKEIYPDLNYISDKKIFLPVKAEYGFELDYSLEANFEGKETLFTWYNTEDDTEVNEDDIKMTESGVFKFLKYGSYYCQMTHHYFDIQDLFTDTVTINAKQQTISFINAPSVVNVNDVNIIEAIASTGLEIELEVIEGDVVQNKNTFTFNKSGIVKIKATQAGNNEYMATEKIIEITVNAAIGIDINEKESFAIYPNPVNSVININFENNLHKIIRLYDMSGNLLMQKNTSLSKVLLNIDSYKRGNYIVEVKSEKGISKHIAIKK